MGAELVVLRGPLAGTRFDLNDSELAIGRAPSCQVVLDDATLGWRHCVIQHEDGRHSLTDYRTPNGTFVNGAKVLRHKLEDGDQIRVGDALLLYRSTRETLQTARSTLLQACSLLFVAEAIAVSEDPDQRRSLEGQFLQLVSDMMPSGQGLLVSGNDEKSILESAGKHRIPPSVISTMVHDSIEDGLFESDGWIAVPLYVRRKLAGLIAVQTQPGEESREILSAIATLTAAAWENAQNVASLRVDNALLREQLEHGRSGILGESSAVKRVLELIERVAPRDTTVLILGESGTGKELVARAVHQGSERRDRPFVAINCAAVTETLLESELFGHEKGAFTGAATQKKGKLEMAEGGSVFLDEIGEMAPGLQAKLLRVLQQREFERVGGTRTIRLDIRLIAATNRDLASEVKKGTFREDLYHRLNVVAIRTPALRDRCEDIPLLSKHFLEKSAEQCRRRAPALSVEAEQLLMSYSWPGNVRELENAIERAVVLGQGDWVLPEDLPETILDAAPADNIAGVFQAKVGNAKRDSIVQAWEQAKGDYKVAAQILGMHPNSLLRLVRNLGLRALLRKA
jgi:two-component system response regulator HydG